MMRFAFPALVTVLCASALLGDSKEQGPANSAP